MGGAGGVGRCPASLGGWLEDDFQVILLDSLNLRGEKCWFVKCIFLEYNFFVSVESYRLFLIGAPVARGPNGPWIQCNVGLIFGGDMVLTNSKFNQQTHKQLSCVLLDSIQVSQPQKRRGLT